MIFNEKYAHANSIQQSVMQSAWHETPKLCRLFIPYPCAPAKNPDSSYSINNHAYDPQLGSTKRAEEPEKL